MNEIIELLLSFAKIGLFTFGGGYAMLPIIESTCVEKKNWISHDDIMNITVMAESTPGPVAINCATFVGYKRKGLIGAAAATLGVILPSFFIIYLIAKVLDNFLEIALIANAFKGIKIAVGILILDAAFKMIKNLQKSAISYAIMISAAVSMLLINILSLKISSIALMLFAGFISLIIFSVRNKKAGEAK